MILGKNVAIFDGEWGQIRPLEMGRKSPACLPQYARSSGSSSTSSSAKSVCCLAKFINTWENKVHHIAWSLLY